MTVTDWLWWGPGGLLVLAGAAVLGRALFADRARGRRRCPRCWHELAPETDRRCQECGRTAKSEWKLGRTRRHWWQAMLGLVLLGGGGALLGGREVHRHGWIGAVPNVGYILFLPHLDLATTHAELHARVEGGDLRQWEYRLLVDRGLGLLESTDDAMQLDRVIELLTRVEQLGHLDEIDGSNQPWKSWARLSEIERARALRVYVSLLDHDESRVRHRAINAITSFGASGRDAIPALVGRLTNDDDHQTIDNSLNRTSGASHVSYYTYWWGDSPSALTGSDRAFFDDLRRCGTDTAAALPVFVGGIDSQDVRVRSIAVWGATVLGAGDATVRRRVLEQFDRDVPHIRKHVARAASAFPLDEHVESVLRRALGDIDEVAIEAARAVRTHGPAGAVFLDELRRGLAERDLSTVRWYAWAWDAVGGGGDAAVDAMLDAGLAGPDPQQVAFALSQIGELDTDAPVARRRIEPLLRHDDTNVRAAAAFAFAACGGDVEDSTPVLLSACAAGARHGTSHLFTLIRRRRLSVPALSEALHSPVADVRAAAAWAFVRMPVPDEALPRLRELLQDADPGVRRSAAWAMEGVEHAGRK